MNKYNEPINSIHNGRTKNDKPYGFSYLFEIRPRRDNTRTDNNNDNLIHKVLRLTDDFLDENENYFLDKNILNKINEM